MISRRRGSASSRAWRSSFCNQANRISLHCPTPSFHSSSRPWRRRFMPLRVKFALFTFVLLILVAAQALVSFNRERVTLVEATENRAMMLTKTLAESAREPLASSRYSRLDYQAGSVLAERDAAYARILDGQGRIVADTRPGFIGWNISGALGNSSLLSVEENLLIARADISIPGRANGMAEVALRLEPLRERLRQSLWVHMRFAIAELLVCAVFLILLSVQLLGPVRAMTHTLIEASATETPVPITLPRASGPEIRSIARAVDELRVRVAEYQAELLAEERLATIGKMAAELAHEVRNPLEAISGAAELLSRGDTGGECIDIIREEIRSLDSYLSGILEFARVGTPGPEAAELSELARETASLALPMAREAGIDIGLRLHESPIPCMVDKSAIKRALFNLFANAIEASPRGSSISLETTATENTMTIRVRDFGAGLGVEARLRAFEPYFTTKPLGTGLGLALVRRIVEAHGGHVYFEDRNEGDAPPAGTVVVVELPSHVSVPHH
ncbi:MAG: hypothetical protein E4H20_09405 [Spirochaetales bacterium]|nr:MAG: hypothetical protein E4H20_09405 [Spirochaetales bacterium]